MHPERKLVANRPKSRKNAGAGGTREPPSRGPAVVGRKEGADASGEEAVGRKEEAGSSGEEADSRSVIGKTSNGDGRISKEDGDISFSALARRLARSRGKA